MVTPDSTESLPSLSLLRNTLECVWFLCTRLSRSLAAYSTAFYYPNTSHIEVLQPRYKYRFVLIPVRSSLTKGISYDLFSSRYLDISVPQVSRHLINQMTPYCFQYRDCSIQTPPDQSFYSAPRRLSRSVRLSSAKQAKASPICISLHTKLIFLKF